MKTFLCHSLGSREQLEAILSGDNDTPSISSRLQPSQSDTNCDLFFLRDQEATPEVLAGYQFQTLVEIDPQFSMKTLQQVLQQQPAPLLQFNVSTSFAYQQRLAKLFLQAVNLQPNRHRSLDDKIYDLALHEAITNATVHGNLELDSGYSDLQSMQLYYKSIAQRLADPFYAGRRIRIGYYAQGSSLEFTVTDEGQGHCLDPDSKVLHNLPHGRGFTLINGRSKSLVFEDEGRTSKIVFRQEG